MASENIDQIFIANPITTNVTTDLMYFGRSPYGVGNDAAMTFGNFSNQFNRTVIPGSSTAHEIVWTTTTVGTLAFSPYTIPATLVANEFLYASSTSALTQLATANNATLITNASGVPSFSTTALVGRLLAVTVFNTGVTTTLTPQTQTTTAIIIAVGGGAAGGNCAGGAGTVGAGGGGGGSFAAVQVTLAQMIGVGTTLGITVGGVGGNTLLRNNGGAGAVIVACSGGNVGINGTNSVTIQTVAGGSLATAPTVSLGTTLYSAQGRAGGAGLGLGSTVGGFGGFGGSSPFGSGGQQIVGSGSAGIAGSGNGAGGGGSISSTAAETGGAGTPGYVAVYEYA